MRWTSTIGAMVGNIIATIIVVHIPMNTSALMSNAMAVPTWATPCTIDDMSCALPTDSHHATPASTSSIAVVVSVARRSRTPYADRGVS